MKTAIIALVASLAAVASHPGTARADCFDPGSLPTAPNPVPDGYDWRPLAEAFCAQLDACGDIPADCVDAFINDAQTAPPFDYTPDPEDTTGGSPDDSQYACQSSVEYESGQVACVTCEPPTNDCGVTVFCGFDANGNFCGDCGPGEQCLGGMCVADSCCDGRSCGPDPCNPFASCGECQEGWDCESGTCTCTSADIPPQCGPWQDDCGGQHDSGPCQPGFACQDGTCQPDDPCNGDPCCGDPCCGDPCCGDPCCGDPCCGDPCCGDPCCGDPCCGDPFCGGDDGGGDDGGGDGGDDGGCGEWWCEF